MHEHVWEWLEYNRLCMQKFHTPALTDIVKSTILSNFRPSKWWMYYHHFSTSLVGAFTWRYYFTTAVLWLLTWYHLFYLWSVFLPTKLDITPQEPIKEGSDREVYGRCMDKQTQATHIYTVWPLTRKSIYKIKEHTWEDLS